MNRLVLGIGCALVSLVLLGSNAHARGALAAALANSGQSVPAGLRVGGMGGAKSGASASMVTNLRSQSVMSGSVTSLLTNETISAGSTPISNGLVLAPNGTMVHLGMTAGSQSSGNGISLVGQSRINSDVAGFGNSRVSPNAQGAGNSQVNIWTRGVGNSQLSLATSAGATNVSQSAFKYIGTSTNIMNFLSRQLSSITSPQTGSTAMGVPINRACASSTGQVATCH